MSEATPQDLLMQAVHAHETAAIDAALAQGANFADEGVEPLYWAASDNRADIVRHLLSRGATIAAEWRTNSRDEPNMCHGDTALHAAAARGDVEVLRMLLGADGKKFLEKFGMQAGWRLTALGVAASAGHRDACRVLLEAGADANANDTSAVGETALSEAVQKGHVEVVDLLLAAGADPRIPGWMGCSALDRAAQSSEEVRARLRAWRAAR